MTQELERINGIIIFLVFVLGVSFVIPDAFGLWIPLSPEQLVEESNTVFVGKIIEIKPVDVEYQSQISRNGTVKDTVGPETMTLEEYTVDVEEFLKNPQNSTVMRVLRATVSGVPSGPAKISGFDIGDRVLFFLPKEEDQTHFVGQYLPESFKIPQQCDAKTVLNESRIELKNSFRVLQNGIVKKDNFTAGVPMNFIYSKDMSTLSGGGLDVVVSIRKEGNDKVDFEKKIHSELAPCKWIASSEWEFTPEKGDYRMYLNIRENEESGGDTSYTGFTVIPESEAGESIKIEKVDDMWFYVSGPFTLRAQSEDTIDLRGVKFSYPYFPLPVTPGGVQKVDITFEDGTKENVGKVGPPDPFFELTKHQDPQAGVIRNTDGTFTFLVKADLEKVSPLKQFNHGVPISEINCKDNLVLIQKYDGSPACVKPETAGVIGSFGRNGWNVSEQLFQSLSENMINFFSDESCPANCLVNEEKYAVDSFEDTSANQTGLPRYLPDNYDHMNFYQFDKNTIVKISTNSIQEILDRDFYWRDHGLFVSYSNPPVTIDPYAQTEYWAKNNNAESITFLQDKQAYLKKRQVQFSEELGMLFPSMSEAQFVYDGLVIDIVGYVPDDEMEKIAEAFFIK